MFVDVILPLPLEGTFTYAVPENYIHIVERGFRVIVPFGKSKHYTGIINKVHNNAPDANFAIKEIHSVVDAYPLVTEQQLKLWEWISFYYICPIGEVFKAAMPSSLKTKDLKPVFAYRTEVFVKLNQSLSESIALSLIGKAHKQKQLYAHLQSQTGEVSKTALLKATGCSAAVLSGLIDKKIVETYDVQVSRLSDDVDATRKPFDLNPCQQQALQEITACFEQKHTCLLYGVTSSGKTEVYIHLILEQLEKGKQVLFLVPEIALTTQLTERLQAVFGSKIGIYHSRINDDERAEIWHKMLSDTPYEILIGVRSSLFLPFTNLGLVIVDEEHEMSYKQLEPSPRYHGRDLAVMLSFFCGAKTLLGSATPSLESFFNVKAGKYGLVRMEKRHAEVELPEILVTNTYELRRKNKMRTLLSPILHQHMEEALNNGEQVILFRNRRGFALLLECTNCGWTPKCEHCDVSLTYHKGGNYLKCHYCGATYPMMTICPVCNQNAVKQVGQGTEQLEEVVAELFPHAIVARMDADTTSRKHAMAKLISDFQQKRIHILIGTQMLAKGLDFDNVTVVGIIAADGMLKFPDFRAHERAFQLMTQAAGRAGRKQKQGVVIVQSADNQQSFYQSLVNHDYIGFVKEQLKERELFRYPPYYRFIRIVLRHKYQSVVVSASACMASQLKSYLGDRVIGPSLPIAQKLKDEYYREIRVKAEVKFSPEKLREAIKMAQSCVMEQDRYKYLHIMYDVDGD